MRSITAIQPAPFFSSSSTSADYLRAKLAGRAREVFAVAFLNNQHQLLAYEEIFHGSIACVEIHPREFVRCALQHNAAAVILSHNHPSFTPNPYQADIGITARLKQALELVGVRVIDHMIVVGNDVVSLAERGPMYSISKRLMQAGAILPASGLLYRRLCVTVKARTR